MTTPIHTAITSCRICGSRDLLPVLDLGEQALAGVFPKPNEQVPHAPLELVRCSAARGCGLVQLRHAVASHLLYHPGYGYRSGLNPSMVQHLSKRVERVLERIVLNEDDAVIDIGSNDGTLLSCYPESVRRIGVDPLGGKLREHYPPGAELITDFFSTKTVARFAGELRPKVITSIAMFYDLPAPLDVVREIATLLHPEGIWVVEQSYLPTMVEQHSYDTICQEHLEYYCVSQFQWMAERSNLRIIDAELNQANGGSFCLTLAHQDSSHVANTRAVNDLLEGEKPYAESGVYEEFARCVARHRTALRSFLEQCKQRGDSVYGLGASTKGNVLLQHCAIGPHDLISIGEVNQEKFGCVTPGTGIPIESEDAIFERQPDFILVLPWHFSDFFVRRRRDYLKKGGRFVFPLPEPTVVDEANADSFLQRC